MGLSSSKTTQTSEPSSWAKGYITPALGQAQSVYDRNQGAVQDISSSVQGLIPGLVDRYTTGSTGLNAAKGYNTDVLSGKYLNGNPYLQGVVDDTNASVANRVNASIGTRGGAGGSAQTQLLGRELAKNETALRYGNYTDERNRMDSAVGAAGGLEGVDNANLATILAAAQAGTQLPFAGTDALVRQIAALAGNSNTTTQTQSGNLLQMLIAAGAQAGSAALMGGGK